jgi:hypothetical protein
MNNKLKRRAIVATLASSPFWIKPVVQQVTLPAHAETTNVPVLTNKSFYTAPTESFGMVEPVNESSNALFDTFISPAMAQTDTVQVALGMLITLSEVGGKVVASSEHLNQRGDVKYSATNIPTDNAAAPTSLSQESSCTGGNHTHIKIVGYTFNANTVTVEITTDGFSRGTSKRTQTVPLGTGTLTLLDCD